MNELLQKELITIGEFTLKVYDLVVFGALALGAIVVSIVMRIMINRLAEGRDVREQANIHIVGKLVYYVLLVVGFMLALSSLGMDISKIALLASALSVGIGFGLQSVFNNFVSGIILLFERSIKVGDVVELEDGMLGTVREINIRSTRVNTPDNMDVIVPNSEFVSTRVRNWTFSDRYRRVRVPFGVHYKSDKEVVRKAALEAASRVPLTITDVEDRAPQAWLLEFGDNSLNFELIVWVDPKAVSKPMALRASYMWELETSFKEYDIEIPYPQRDIHLRTVYGEEDAPIPLSQSQESP
ncbi:transporter, MscS family [gamma proteobacterium HTCC5015]|nr:transporter, MscS family [gamma proteobacterium HTCC5015]